MSSTWSTSSPFARALIAGAAAGAVVDISLYPIDTLKTRLQSAKGFAASGGFRGVYAGIGSVALGSAPCGALFFVTYEWLKTELAAQEVFQNASWSAPVVHMLAGSVGEIASCAVRVPTEVVKQRAQAGEFGSSAAALRAILRRKGTVGVFGVWREMYRGWNITVMRDVPFTVIQFPLWEAMRTWRSRRTGREVSAVDSAVFGFVSGAVAAVFTTPLDVLKTRMMLATESVGIGKMASRIWRESGPKAFFAGVGPRLIWISGGGFVYLGVYQFVDNALGRKPR